MTEEPLTGSSLSPKWEGEGGHSPTPKNSGQVKTAGPNPVQGTSMGSMQARNTSSSVKGAMTWLRSQRMSVRQSTQ